MTTSKGGRPSVPSNHGTRPVQYVCLVLDSNSESSEKLRREFPAWGFRPKTVGSYLSALEFLDLSRFDAVLVSSDALLGDYLAAIQMLKRYSNAPVVLMTSAEDEATQLAGFNAGASDVVMLPASTRLIAARLKRVVEGYAQPITEHTEVSIGSLTLSARRRSATFEHIALPLTAHQFDLMYLLAVKFGQFVHRDAIARAAGGRAVSTGRSVDVHVYHIRKKLRAMGVTSLKIETIHGQGYCLLVDTPVGDRVDGELAPEIRTPR